MLGDTDVLEDVSQLDGSIMGQIGYSYTGKGE